MLGKLTSIDYILIINILLYLVHVLTIFRHSFFKVQRSPLIIDVTQIM